MSIPKNGVVSPYVDFTSSTDTNRDEEAAIQPCQNLEPIRATNVTDSMRRPQDNLRQRTELLRGNIDDLLYLSNADRVGMLFDPGSCVISWDGTVANGGSGIFTISSNLYHMPFATVGNSGNTPPVGGAFGKLTLARADDVAIIRITSVLPSWAGGDRVSCTVVGGASLDCVILGDYDIILTIVDGTTTRLQAITKLNAVIGGIGTATAIAGADNDIVKTSQAKRYAVGNWDSEAHVLTAANIASFFGNAANKLKEGDSLCVWYANIIENGATGGRRQATPENTNTTIPAGSYFNSSVNPERLYNCIPICKVINNRLRFVDGTIVLPNTAVGLGGALANSIAYGGGPAWLDGTTNPATTVENQLDKVVTDLSVQNTKTGSGAAKIGSEAGKTVTRGSVASQIYQLEQDKISGMVYPGFTMYSFNNEAIVINPFDCVIDTVHRTVDTVTTLTGVTTGLTKGSWYYLYAYWNGAAVAFEYSTTVPNSTLRTKNGDATRTYLGAFRPTSVNGRLPYFVKRDREVEYSRPLISVENRGSAVAQGQDVTLVEVIPPHVLFVKIQTNIYASNNAVTGFVETTGYPVSAAGTRWAPSLVGIPVTDGNAGHIYQQDIISSKILVANNAGRVQAVDIGNANIAPGAYTVTTGLAAYYE